MLIIPAIDIKDGKCVRLRQGDMDRETIYSDDPATMAERWIEQGARRIHVVDLDGASQGKPVNADIVHKITQRHPEVPVQIGGGIRNEETVAAYIQAGVKYAIIGTQAVREPQMIDDLCSRFPGQVIVGLDAHDGKIAIEGWSEISEHSAIDLARNFEHAGVDSIVYTDISRDGMLQGANVSATAALAGAVSIPVIASGGIASLDDIRLLAEYSQSGIVGAITGRAIYEGRLDFSAAQALADELVASCPIV
ncbi:MAG: 1-(5-phosphoribosyl)-5-[(5-phosphoribosylamino)methylideneamino]imidazole-4-carboxamide isomerase [Gammaproteobacteria bacterium]|nr:1-(5-phosphoribosyl)-5-[(5-phosphoribosylamino)methylideneamino]imidazole-4-carboxamide isomerase [Gammaproteobacteria bacterium]